MMRPRSTSRRSRGLTVKPMPLVGRSWTGREQVRPTRPLAGTDHLVAGDPVWRVVGRQDPAQCREGLNDFCGEAGHGLSVDEAGLVANEVARLPSAHPERTGHVADPLAEQPGHLVVDHGGYAPPQRVPLL